MDVIKSKNSSNWASKRLKSPFAIPIATVAIIALSVTILTGHKAKFKIQRSDTVLSEVSRGDLKITVDGYGILRSRKQTLITAQTPATVKEVLLRPGAKVSKDSIILRLSRPQLIKELQTSKLALKQENSNLQRLVLSNRRELLREQTNKIDLSGDVEMASLLKEAQLELVPSGIISALTFKRTVLEEKQKKQKLAIFEQTLIQLKAELKIGLAIQEEQVNIAQARYDSIELQVEQLTVKAGFDGVLQRLPVELGQSVIAGQELALVGSEKDLVALIQIPQSKAEQLKVGQPAMINTRREKAQGILTRITPQVRDGSIEIEIAFTGTIPKSARPELNVDAEVYVAEFKDTLYIERPLNAQSNSDFSLFKVTRNDTAVIQNVKFGLDSGRYIQLIDGAQESERFIISDMSGYSTVNELEIVN